MFYIESLSFLSKQALLFIIVWQSYKFLPVIKIFFDGQSFFLFPYFHHTLPVTPPTLAVNPLFSFAFGCHTCLSNNSLISSLILTKLLSVFVLCILYKSNSFQAQVNTLTYLRVNFTQQVESSHNPYLFQFFCMTL